jgi:two-component system sensor histidine kinase KdpD
MKSRALFPSLLRAERPSRLTGVLVAVASVAAATGVIYPLKQVAPVVSLGVVYLLAVVVVATFWGLAFGIAAALLSAAAFNFFHLPPVGRFTLADSSDWVALSAFVVVAVAVGLVAELARTRAREADERRREADLAAELAQVLLGATQLEDALAVAAQRLATSLNVPSAAIELDEVEREARNLAFALAYGGVRIGTLVLPSSLSDSERVRVAERVVPSLESILAAARHRAELQAEVVETAALRRSDDVKTALLRAVSHDLRSPLTAIVAAGHALGARSLTEAERAELSGAVVGEGGRLSSLVDKLLDLSRLQAGGAEPRLELVSIEDVLLAAREGLASSDGDIRLSIAPELPPVHADGSQLERAFTNLLENARRYSGGRPVSLAARRLGSQIVVRVVDQGPGIPAAEQERIFEPFYRGAGNGPRPWTGSGLGLAIAKGFIEANGGGISVESLPGQGTSFVVALPAEASR